MMMLDSGTTRTAATYERVSRVADDVADQRERERSVEQQRVANEQACTRYGWTITERYADPGRSASRFATRARENWQHVLEAVKGRRFDVLVVWETSRASRDPEEWIPLLAECRRHGVKIYVTVEDELYDPGKARHWKVLASAGIDNAYASEETSQRVRRGVDDHAAAGKPYGPVLYGYERIYDAKTREFVEQRPHPQQAGVVKDIITSVYEGKSLKSIVARLNDAGIASPRGAQWSMRAVRRVALNPGYIGLRGHHGQITEGIWPGIVEPEVFYGARRILTDPKRTTTRPGRAKWLASCIARCGECGGWMAVARRGLHRTVYFCRDGGHCWIEREDLDDYLTRLVVERCSRPEVYPQLPDGVDGGVVEELRGRLAGLRAALEGYVEDAAEGKIDRVFAAKVVAKLTAKVEATQREIEAAVTPSALAGLLSGAHSGQDVAQRWERAPVSARREVLRLLFDSITVAKGRGEVQQRVTIRWR